MPPVMLFYKNVTPLSRDAHKALRLKPVGGAGFAAQSHWMPLAGTEFYQASRSHPIVFVREGEGAREQIAAIALLGLEAGRNDHVSKYDQWRRDSYVPAFVRRYPFVLANTPEKGEELMICFDASFEGLNEKEGKRLFDKDGGNSTFLNEMIQFMNGFRLEMERTKEFVAALGKLGLLEQKSADIRSPGGASFQLQEFLMVSEEKFAKLSGTQLAELHKQGFLGWIFAHLMSLANLPVLLETHLANKAAGTKAKETSQTVAPTPKTIN